MPSRTLVGNTKEWSAVRQVVLDRDGRVCQIQLDCCTRVATQVDHIIAAADGGAHYDPENLRAACAPCNRKLGGKVGNRRKAMKKRQASWSRAW
jgi:5-methylcytosine-specific restriction endonuclease McrA